MNAKKRMSNHLIDNDNIKAKFIIQKSQDVIFLNDINQFPRSPQKNNTNTFPKGNWPKISKNYLSEIQGHSLSPL